MNRTFALIPAAGKSTRMGRPKLALPLGDRTVLECAIDVLRTAGIEHVLVVVAPHVLDLAPVAARAGAEVLPLAAETPDMRATVEAGLCWLEERLAPGPGDAWLLLPADHPTIHPGVIRQLLQARTAYPDCSIVLPAHAGRRGHPALIELQHDPGMRALPDGQGLNVYLRNHTAETYEVMVDSPTVLLDLDTPEDYKALQESWSKLSREKSAPRPVRTGIFWLDVVLGLWKAFWLISWAFVGAVLGGMVDPSRRADPMGTLFGLLTIGTFAGLLIGFKVGVAGIKVLERLLRPLHRSADE